MIVTADALKSELIGRFTEQRERANLELTHGNLSDFSGYLVILEKYRTYDRVLREIELVYKGLGKNAE